MQTFDSLTRMDRRKFLAGFLATAATAGVLGKLGIEAVEWTTARLELAQLHEADVYVNDTFIGRVPLEDKGDGYYAGTIPADMTPPKNELITVTL